MIVPELIMQQVIARGIEQFRTDDRKILHLLRNFTAADQASVVRYFQKNPIDVTVNFPREGIKIPHIAILMRSETESHPFLNDDLSPPHETPEPFSWDAPDTDEGELLGGGSVSAASGLGELLIGGPAASGTSDTLTLAAGAMLVGEHVGRLLRLVGGHGVGQIRTITANTHDTFTVSPAWTKVPDSTTRWQVRENTSDMLGEPQYLYTRDPIAGGPPTVERKGQGYAAQYQIRVAAHPPEMMTIIYNMLKAIFTDYRIFMERHGMYAFRMSGTDIAPMPDLFPEVAFLRAMNVEFNYISEHLTVLEPPTELRISLLVGPETTGQESPPEVEVIQTDISISPTS